MRWTFGLVVLALGGASRPAHAASFQAPGECVDEAGFAAALSARVTEPPVDADAWEVRIEALEEGFRGTARWRGRTRRLVAPTCDEVTEALALSLALRMRRAPREPEPVSPPSPEPLPPVVPLPPAPAPAEPPPREAPWSWQWSAGVGVRGVTGRGPGLRPAIEAEVGMRRADPGWAVGFGLAAFRVTSGELVPTTRAGTARTHMVGGRASLVPLGWRTASLGITASIEAEVAEVTAEGQLDLPGRSRSAWFAVGGAVRGSWRPVGPLELWLGGGFTAPPSRFEVQFLRPEAVLYTAAPVGAHLGGGVSALFP